MNAYIARQPIFDREKRVAGYELLYRSGLSNVARIHDEDMATQGVLSDAITVFGLRQLTNRRPAYINFTRNLILNDFALLANPREIVIEVPGDIEVDSLLIDKLLELKRAGYSFSLKDYKRRGRFHQFTQLFDVIRVNFSALSAIQRRETMKKLGQTGGRLLAERLETEDDFVTAVNLGFALFQGYYFERPSCLSKEMPPLSASSYGRLLQELLRPSVDFDICTDIIQHDVVLTYLLLRQVHTAQYYRGNTISGIRHCIVMMGTENLRRWVCLVLLRQNNVTSSNEMSRRAYLRGRFAELLMENANTRLDPRQGFLLGMFSLLDQVMGVRLETLLGEMDLDPRLKAALMGQEENEYARFLQYVVIYEMGNEKLILPDIRLRLSEDEVSRLYMECMVETDAAFDRMGG